LFSNINKPPTPKLKTDEKTPSNMSYSFVNEYIIQVWSICIIFIKIFILYITQQPQSPQNKAKTKTAHFVGG
jgi:hypothetical protein